MKHHGNGRRTGGFSLIEILAAVAIFSLCVVALIEGMTRALADWRLAEEKTHALMLAENVMEEVLYNNALETGEESGQCEAPDDRYGWATVVDETQIPGLFTVSVNIAWHSGGHGRDVTLATMRMRREEMASAAAEASAVGGFP